jgi:pyridoxal phosphate enzyme (YggS family)
MTVDIRANLERTRDRIARAAERSGRTPEDITLVAIAKTFPVHVVEEAIAAGIGDVGENRAQELRDKVAVLGDRVRWHFVGHLQTNKVRTVVGGIVLLHSVDRYGLAEAVARRARSLDMVQDVLLEVNISGEPSKHGVEPAATRDLASEVAALEGVRVRGLMTMPPLTEDPEDSRPYFRDLASLRDELVGYLPEATELSMGMTRDFEVGVEEGATLVRIGEAVFGPR